MKKLQKRYQKEKEQIHARFVAEGKVGYGASCYLEFVGKITLWKIMLAAKLNEIIAD